MIEEVKYPIYCFSYHWVQDGINDGDRDKDLDIGRTWNSTSFNKMYKEDQTIEDLQKLYDEFWSTYEGKNKYSNVVLRFILERDIKLILRETWCLTWFSHYTFDIGQSDDEAQRSFSEFVSRMRPLEARHGYCLMGADDTWRWRGPCRCEHCKRLGLIRFDH